jgi:Rieske Fe-S protein
VGELADLQRQHVLEPDFNGNRIHLRPDLLTAQPIALSLICSHKQCTVAWQPEAQRFECPCHKGQYDAQGQVLAGKPKAPLRQFRVEIRNGTQIWVLNESPVS